MDRPVKPAARVGPGSGSIVYYKPVFQPGFLVRPNKARSPLGSALNGPPVLTVTKY